MLTNIILNKILQLWLLFHGALCFLVTLFSVIGEREALVPERMNRLNCNNNQNTEAIQSLSHNLVIEMPSSSNVIPTTNKMGKRWRVTSTALLFGIAVASLADESKTRNLQMQQLDNNVIPINQLNSRSGKHKLGMLYCCSILRKIEPIDLLIRVLCAAYILWYKIRKFGPKDGWQEGGTIMIMVVLVSPLLPVLNFAVRKYLERASTSSKSALVVRNYQPSLSEQKISKKIKTKPLKDRLHKLKSVAETFSLGVAIVMCIVMMARYFSGNSLDDNDYSEFQAGKKYILDDLYFTLRILLITSITADCMDLDCLSWVFQISLAHSINKMMTQNVLILKPLSLERMGRVNTIVTDCLDSPLGLKEAFDECLNAGVKIKVLTEDHCITTDHMATYCGILNSSSQVLVEAQEFRSYSQEERMEKIDDILVMTGCSSSDKLLFVECLKQKEQFHVVAAAMACEGDQIEEILNIADVGVLLVKGANLSSHEVQVAYCDIVILDGNFASVAKALTWGRSVHKNTQNLILFQLIAGLNSLSKYVYIDAFSSGTPQIERLVMTLLEVIWVNYGLGILAAIVLGTQQPDKALMKLQPSKPLITNKMWVKIVVHSAYQISIMGILWWGVVFKVNGKNDTMIFAFTVFCQVFNLFNARKPEEKIVFKGIEKNPLFLGVGVAIITIYMFVLLVLPNVVGFDRLDLQQWMTCALLGSASLLIDLVAKSLPIKENQPSLPFCC